MFNMLLLLLVLSAFPACQESHAAWAGIINCDYSIGYIVKSLRGGDLPVCIDLNVRGYLGTAWSASFR